MLGEIPPVPQCVFMAWCLVKYRDNFTFYLVRFIILFTRASQWSLFWARQIQSKSSHPISLRFRLMSSSHLLLSLPSCVFSSGFPIKILCPFLIYPTCAICPAHFMPLDFITLIIPGEASHYAVFSSLPSLPPTYLLLSSSAFPLLRSFQIIRLCPMPGATFRHMAFSLSWGGVSPAPNPQAGGPSLVSYPLPIFQ